LDGMAPELIEHRHSTARRKRQHQVVVYVLGVGQRIGIDENRIVATAVRNCAVAGADYSIDGREKIVVITRPGSQSIVALKSADLIVTTAAVEDIVQFVPNYGVGRVGARHVLDTAQDIRFHSRCRSRNGLCANEKTIASVLSELDAIHLTRERRQAV